VLLKFQEGQLLLKFQEGQLLLKFQEGQLLLKFQEGQLLLKHPLEASFGFSRAPDPLERWMRL
jgi:hypothetical protein